MASESALERAKEAAGGRDVSLGGGANVIQQYLAAGLVDELQLNVVPVVLGEGTRLFDNIAGADINLQFVQVVEVPGVTHLTYRVVR
jgi:dihydrofolate reductase